MNGEPTRGVEDIVRRNIATLRSQASLTQQGLADEMLLRGIAWTRETVAQVETTSRRLGFTEAIAVAACLDVPIARLTATGSATVAVGEGQWSAAYLGAALAGSIGDTFPPEAFASPASPASPAPPAPPARRAPAGARPPGGAEPPASPRARTAEPPGRASLPDEPSGRRRARRPAGDDEGLPAARGRGEWLPEQAATAEPIPPGPVPEGPPAGGAPRKAAERIERRLRLRVTASDVDATAQHLWSRSLEAERERRVADRQALTGGSAKTIRGHVSRDLDRELAHEMERRPPVTEEPYLDDDLPADEPEGGPPVDEVLSPEEIRWEATRLNILLANKGYNDSDVTRWWNFTRHGELGGRAVAEAWEDGDIDAVVRLIESLPDVGTEERDYLDE